MNRLFFGVCLIVSLSGTVMATDTARPDSGVSVPGQKPGPTQYYAAGEKFYSAFRYEQALKYYLQAIKLDKTYLDT